MGVTVCLFSLSRSGRMVWIADAVVDNIPTCLDQRLVRLAYENETAASYVSPCLYDATCPLVNDPSPAQGAF